MMTEPQDRKPEQPDQAQQPELTEELRELGQQIEKAFRGVVENERAKTLQRDFIAGIRELGHQMQEGLNTLKENEHVQNLTERGQQTINQVQSTGPAREFQVALTKGVSQLREQIEHFNVRMYGGEADDKAGAQNISIEHEDTPPPPATTGQTVRLDPDKPEQS